MDGSLGAAATRTAHTSENYDRFYFWDSPPLGESPLLYNGPDFQPTARLKFVGKCGIISTEKPEHFDFQGVPASLVTNVLKVHRSKPYHKGFR